jgi:FkbM family methyltransferase
MSGKKSLLGRIRRRGARVAQRGIAAVRAVGTFQNFAAYFAALRTPGSGRDVLRTRDGLEIGIRRNRWDARIVRETFLERPYVRYYQGGPAPVVVDIGSYIGDFALYAAWKLNARVVAYEPTAENYALLRENVERNGLQDRVTTVNEAVGTGGELVLNVAQGASDEIHVSAYWYPGAERRTVRCATLQEVCDRHVLERIDLLKVDCEGGEYDIFLDAPDALFDRIGSIVFEWHTTDGWEERLPRVKDRLRERGFQLRQHGMIMYAQRR